ncbi:MAG: hypothetical protein B6I25_07985 [Planctomycetales bacterium 4572_13]|nr:MAG: hypothetical protein B6I25_07985 [Planctomycetales bacterium 4572_13]
MPVRTKHGGIGAFNAYWTIEIAGNKESWRTFKGNIFDTVAVKDLLIAEYGFKWRFIRQWPKLGTFQYALFDPCRSYLPLS